MTPAWLHHNYNQPSNHPIIHPGEPPAVFAVILMPDIRQSQPAGRNNFAAFGFLWPGWRGRGRKERGRKERGREHWGGEGGGSCGGEGVEGEEEIGWWGGGGRGDIICFLPIPLFTSALQPSL
jgi:hypothetical protein